MSSVPKVRSSSPSDLIKNDSVYVKLLKACILSRKDTPDPPEENSLLINSTGNAGSSPASDDTHDPPKKSGRVVKSSDDTIPDLPDLAGLSSNHDLCCPPDEKNSCDIFMSQEDVQSQITALGLEEARSILLTLARDHPKLDWWTLLTFNQFNVP